MCPANQVLHSDRNTGQDPQDSSFRTEEYLIKESNTGLLDCAAPQTQPHRDFQGDFEGLAVQSLRQSCIGPAFTMKGWTR